MCYVSGATHVEKRCATSIRSPALPLPGIVAVKKGLFQKSSGKLWWQEHNLEWLVPIAELSQTKISSHQHNSWLNMKHTYISNSKTFVSRYHVFTEVIPWIPGFQAFLHRNFPSDLTWCQAAVTPADLVNVSTWKIKKRVSSICKTYT